jgi:site-specific recombinase XerD
MERRSIVTIYVRHSEGCEHKNRKNATFYRGCDCVKWLRYSGEFCFCKATARVRRHSQHKLSADTRSWSTAEDKRSEMQRRLDSGETGSPVPTVDAKRATVAQALETFIQAKEGEGCSTATIRKLRNQITGLERFLAERSKFFPNEITATDLIEFRSGWTWKSGLTRQKAQQNFRGFLRSCCKENLTELLAALKTIRLSKADVARLEPQPFSEAELKKLVRQISKTFPNDAEKAARMTALIHLQVSTGLAIRDAVQLERDSIKGGWLKIRRQKTNRPVEQKLDEGLHRELLAVANGNPKYIFWNGTSQPTSATGLWQTDLRELMDDAGLWIKGNLSHRFRDTAVDFWIGQGCSIVEIAAMLGDTVTIVEKHYRKLLSGRMAERLAKVPTRSW